ncbi:MAG: hypothetical protein ABI577_10390 [bacterium]
MIANELWRKQSEAESELLRVVLLADFPERDIVEEALRESRVRLGCDCGCGSLEFETSAGLAGLRPDWGMELVGQTLSGRSVGVALRLRGGDSAPVLHLEITQLQGSEDFVKVRPESLRQDRVTHIKEGVTYSVPRELTVVEEASRRPN